MHPLITVFQWRSFFIRFLCLHAFLGMRHQSQGRYLNPVCAKFILMPGRNRIQVPFIRFFHDVYRHDRLMWVYRPWGCPGTAVEKEVCEDDAHYNHNNGN
ncbi:hypothetical protein IW261DRAFT_1526651 [Armillaria novae-zelandiae]|uniref:Secreted protein n=1 Tax=Armillaria novae-zelandiae TaxID=153914 RepID=A0AA39TTQ6_9AGAR|nr:hypothetical protein IW261DRAFT_1526651 [Armillaria novae-zelandiae]